MRRGTSSIFIVFLIVLSLSVLAAPYTVSATTDKQEYKPGDKVTVHVTIKPAETVVLLWEVKDPEQKRRDFGQVTCQGGSCSFDFVTGSNWPTGTYTLIIAVSGTNDKGYVTFTLRVPEAQPPAPPPSAPPAIDYAFLSRIRIEATNKSLCELNATIRILSHVMNTLNLTLNPEYLEQLNRIAETLKKAIDSYSKKNYENAYTLANLAYQEITKLIEVFANDAIQVFRNVLSYFLARTQDPTTVELLNSIVTELASASPTDKDILTKLAATGRVLVVIARTLKVPELEKSLLSLSQKAEALEGLVKSLNQSNVELQAKLLVLQSEKSELAEQVENLTSLVSELRRELNRVNQLNAELSNENLQLKEQLSQSVTRSSAIAAALAAALMGAAVGTALGKFIGKKRK
ncbi:MAG: hypothetical protein QXO97_08660 [Candidatus Nezhaarchaeales archaeon]